MTSAHRQIRTFVSAEAGGSGARHSNGVKLSAGCADTFLLSTRRSALAYENRHYLEVVITPEDAVALAIDAAEDGLAAGEMPIGAVVLSGERLLSRAFTQERTLSRRIVHADLLALEEADSILGFARTQEPLVLAVNLEPCMMCLGAAITLGAERVYYALESPNDGAVDLLTQWQPPVEQPFFCKPVDIRGGFHRSRSQELFRRYAAGTGPVGMRRWAGGLADS